jgi:hypothetical protein
VTNYREKSRAVIADRGRRRKAVPGESGRRGRSFDRDKTGNLETKIRESGRGVQRSAPKDSASFGRRVMQLRFEVKKSSNYPDCRCPGLNSSSAWNSSGRQAGSRNNSMHRL